MCVRERERERGRDIDTATERERNVERKRQTERERNLEKKREKEREKLTERLRKTKRARERKTLSTKHSYAIQAGVTWRFSKRSGFSQKRMFQPITTITTADSQLYTSCLRPAVTVPACLTSVSA